MKKVVIIATGGTIAMKKNNSGKSSPAIFGEKLIESVPCIREIADFEIVNFSNFASCNMSPENLIRLAKKVEDILKNKDINGIVITHGTDTVEESAFFLELTIDDERPIIFTAAQRDASEIDSDGPRNIKNAARIATDERAKNRGVMVSLNEEIFGALYVQKTHTSNIKTFSSGEMGMIGYVDIDKICFYNFQKSKIKFKIPENFPVVIPIMAFTGMDSNLIEFCVRSGARGIVIEAFGRGNVPPELEDGILFAREKKIPVVITSRCYNGRVLPVYSYKGGSSRLKDFGCIFSEGLSTAKSRLLLGLALTQTDDSSEIQDIFTNILC
ncbi:Asparaginase [Thermodesulfobium narugense DSM 14796]|uniref:Asparaginase n=1 Tax=Thermodesulfobium narugense DSM 14796 TaxID=747365 RepID=M1E785_9BACT|nr:asparaginase [Thermodesulfobium narugense]AEE14538.1 Asparaginase [Thermodesulfobium narugense DSM 14796]